MVDVERVGSRLDRLEHLIELLEQVRAGGEAAYLQDERLRAMTERWLQLAIQTCIDVGAQLVSELAVEPPPDYAGVFRNLASAGHIDRDLADALAAAGGQSSASRKPWRQLGWRGCQPSSRLAFSFETGCSSVA